MSPRGPGRLLFIRMPCTLLRLAPASMIFYASRTWISESLSVRRLQISQGLSKHCPRASFCFDVGHARHRLKQLHVSDVNTQSKHDPLSLESMLAFHRVSHLVPPEIPIIMESRVDEAHICEELERAVKSLTPIG
jgi:hypothetical protein